MTVYVIDPSRPLPSTHGDDDHALDLVESDVVILSEGAVIEASGRRAYGIKGGTDTTLFIDGNVFSAYATAIATHGTISIGTSGSAEGEWYGVELLKGTASTNPSVLTNDGYVWGFAKGVVITSTEAVIDNSGTISSPYCGISATSFGRSLRISNSGMIEGDAGIDAGSFSEGAKLILNNTGIIKGAEGAGAVFGVQNGQNIVRNRGHVEGDVWFGDGNDVYDCRGGALHGVLNLGKGDDTAYGGDGAETFFGDGGHNYIDGGGGIDTLKFAYEGYQYGVPITIDLRNPDEQQVNKFGHIAWYTVRNVENLIGNSDDDIFTGDDAANMFVGAAGHDRLDGQGANDILNGGTGNDTLVGGGGTDIAMFSGRLSDYGQTFNADGTVTIVDLRASGDSVDVLKDVEFAIFSDTIFTLPTASSTVPVTHSSPATPSGAPFPPSAPTPSSVQNLSFRGSSKADTFIGGEGHDLINGGLGNDTLTGGDGQDTFAFSSKLGPRNVDWIADFDHANDSIKLSKAIFSKLPTGILFKGAFWIGSKAHDKSDRIIYNETTGALSYDADGSGTKYAAVRFAQLKAKTLLATDDFLIG